MKHLEDYRTIHAADPQYGSGPGTHELEIIASLCRHIEVSRAIDYGCGNSRALERLWPQAERALYDPAMPGRDRPPAGQFDVGLCTDVLEHVPEDELHELLKYLWELSTRWVFVIHTAPARQLLPSGENAHVTQRPAAWWGKIIGQFFNGGLAEWQTNNAYRVGFCTWSRP